MPTATPTQGDGMGPHQRRSQRPSLSAASRCALLTAGARLGESRLQSAHEPLGIGRCFRTVLERNPAAVAQPRANASHRPMFKAFNFSPGDPLRHALVPRNEAGVRYLNSATPRPHSKGPDERCSGQEEYARTHPCRNDAHETEREIDDACRPRRRVGNQFPGGPPHGWLRVPHHSPVPLRWREPADIDRPTLGCMAYHSEHEVDGCDQ